MKTISLNTLSDATVGVSVIKFYATWCGPCKMMTPIVESVAKNLPDVHFFEVNVDDDRNMANAYDVTTLPTIVILDNGKVVDKLIGFKSAAVLTEAILKHV